MTVSFLSAPPLRVKLFSIRHRLGNPARTYEPTSRDVELTQSWLRRAYPVAEVLLTHTTIDAPKAWPFTCDDVNLQLAAIRRQDVATGEDDRTHYYGMVPDANGASFMRGCAADIPGHAAPNTVASGPAGAATFDWDFDGSYADWYTAHELAHTFGRYHSGFCTGNSSNDPNFPYPNGSLIDSAGDFVGLDVGDAALGVAMAALPGVSWRDVMTYCKNQWMSAFTYTGIRDRLAAEDGLPGAHPPAPLAGLQPAPMMEAAEADSIATGLIHVLASLDLEHNTGKIVQVNPVTHGNPSRPTPGNPAVIHMLNEAGAVFRSTPLRIKESSCCEGKDRHGMLDALLPAPDGAHVVQLQMDGKIVDSFSAKPMPVENDRLSKRVVPYPHVAAVHAEAAAAPVDEGLTYKIEVSSDQGATWQTVATGLRLLKFEPDASQYPGVSSLLVRITATNGFSIRVTQRVLPL